MTSVLPTPTLINVKNTGQDVKESVRVGTISNLDFSTDFSNGQIIDGVTLITNNRILIKNQSDATTNGIYIVNSSGEPTRSDDFDEDDEVTANTFTFISEGDTQADTQWVVITNDPIQVGITDIQFTQYGSAIIPSANSISQGDSSVTVNDTGSGEIISAIDGLEAMRISNLKRLGIGTVLPDKKVEINDSNGDCLRLTNNDTDGSASNYTDLSVSSTGIYNISPSANQVCINSNNAVNDTTINNLKLVRQTTAIPLNNLGVGIDFHIENSSNVIKSFGSIEIFADDITNNSEDGLFEIKLSDSGTIDSVLTLDSTGALTVFKLVESSDKRIKENFSKSDIFKCFNNIININLTDFSIINDKKKQIFTGIIAQDLIKIIPNAVNISKFKNIDDFHSISSKDIQSHIIGAIQVLNKQNIDFKKKFNYFIFINFSFIFLSIFIKFIF